MMKDKLRFGYDNTPYELGKTMSLKVAYGLLSYPTIVKIRQYCLDNYLELEEMRTGKWFTNYLVMTISGPESKVNKLEQLI